MILCTTLLCITYYVRYIFVKHAHIVQSYILGIAGCKLQAATHKLTYPQWNSFVQVLIVESPWMESSKDCSLVTIT